MTTSVVIPTAGSLGAGGTAVLLNALNAVQEADEVVVVITDEQMTDAGWQVLAAADCKIVDIEGDFNFSRAVNAGVAETHGSHVILLNDDVGPTRRHSEAWIQRLVRKRADIKGVRLVTPDEWHVEHTGVEFAGPGGLPSHRGWRQPAAVEYPDGPVLAVTAAAMMFSRQVFDSLEGFDEEFPLNYGDVDFCLRAREVGLRTMVYNSITLTHKEASTRGLSNPVPDFKHLITRHQDVLSEEGIEVDPDAADRYYAGVIYA